MDAKGQIEVLLKAVKVHTVEGGDKKIGSMLLERSLKTIYVPQNSSVQDLESKLNRILNKKMGNVLKIYRKKMGSQLARDIDEFETQITGDENKNATLDLKRNEVIVVEIIQDAYGKNEKSVKKLRVDPTEQIEEIKMSNNSTTLAKNGGSIQDIKTLCTGKQAGVVGLRNLGNTCFMNSGIQCLSNIKEMTEYFLSEQHLKELNPKNRDGLGGKLAKAYGELMKEMWQSSLGSTSPADLKFVLGSSVERFSGYGQQDSSELLNYLIDYIHQDINQSMNAKYKEIPDDDGTQSDKEMAQIFWDSFQEFNRSYLVDLFYG